MAAEASLHDLQASNPECHLPYAASCHPGPAAAKIQTACNIWNFFGERLGVHHGWLPWDHCTWPAINPGLHCCTSGHQGDIIACLLNLEAQHLSRYSPVFTCFALGSLAPSMLCCTGLPATWHAKPQHLDHTVCQLLTSFQGISSFQLPAE